MTPLVAVLALPACGVEPADTGTRPDDTAPLTLDGLAGACDPAERWGRFSVEADESYALVTGMVRDGVVPADVLDEVETDGDCTLWRRTNPYCDPGCSSDEACTDAGECVPYPLGQDLGTVTVEGLLETVAMEPVEPDNSYFDTSIPNPPWTDGAVVRLTAGTMELEGLGFPTFAPNEPAWTISSGAPLAVTWSAAPSDTLTTVHLDLTIDQHGATPLTLTCEFADDGTGEVPAALVDQLVASGVTGYPNGRIGRRTVDRAEWSTGSATGCVEMVVTQPVVPDVTVSGFYPCTGDEDCPGELTCDEAQELCV